MDFLHLTFNDFEFRDLGHSDFLSFKVLAPTHISFIFTYLLHSGRHSTLDMNARVSQ